MSFLKVELHAIVSSIHYAACVVVGKLILQWQLWPNSADGHSLLIASPVNNKPHMAHSCPLSSSCPALLCRLAITSTSIHVCFVPYAISEGQPALVLLDLTDC